jgi:prolyl-tRNA synthetase
MNRQLPDIKGNFAEWYHEVIDQAQLVDQSPVRGSMVVRPYGCALWEQMVKILDARFKATGHENALFPLFIPESFLKKEADHVAGFAPELAVVTHAGGKELEEPLIVRPTSETIIHYMFARWITSWRDLPLKINQWANVVRWEMRPRPFLRTTEFYWQEGHTAHATHAEAVEEAELMLKEYVSFAYHYLAIPVITGQKTESEKFPGAEKTLTFEGIMQDGKALQMGTSHVLSQSFCHAFDIKFQDQDGKLSVPYLTSWGVTTRLIGAVVMTHGDQKGLVLPPFIAPIQVVIIPIYKSGQDNGELIQQVEDLSRQCIENNIRVHVDSTEHQTPGAKFYTWELKGVPIRVEIGARDVAVQQITLVTRYNGQKIATPVSGCIAYIEQLLVTIHQEMLKAAEVKVSDLTHVAEKLEVFGPQMDTKQGVYKTSWCGNSNCEAKVKEYKGTVRCIVPGNLLFAYCFACNERAKLNIIVAKAY